MFCFCYLYLFAYFSLQILQFVLVGASSVAIDPKKKRKKDGKNALSAHLRGLFAAIGVSNDF